MIRHVMAFKCVVSADQTAPQHHNQLSEIEPVVVDTRTCLVLSIHSWRGSHRLELHNTHINPPKKQKVYKEAVFRVYGQGK